MNQEQAPTPGDHSGTGALAPRASEVLDALGAADDGPIVGEYLTTMIELVSGVHATVDAAVAEMASLLGQVVDAAAPLGLGILAAGTHPFARPEDAPRSALLLLAGSSEPMDGPSGMWSWASRRLAVEEGTFSLRFDRSGVGDAADFDELTQPFSFSRAMLQDVADAVGYLTRASGRTPVAAGLCSGGYFLLMTIVAQQLARVCALNVLSWAPEIEDVPPFANEITSPEDLEVVEERNEHSLKRRLRTWAKTHMPYVVWEQLGSVFHFNVPGPLLTRASRQTEVVLAFSRLDWEAFRLQRGEEAVRRAQAAGGRLTTTLEFRMDHSLLDPLARAAVLPILRNLVRD